MGVAAGHGQTREREAELRHDHVNDPLVRAEVVEQRYAELPRVPLEGLHLGRRHLVRHGKRPVVGWDVVVHHREGQVRPPHLPLSGPQPLEGDRRGDLVRVVAIYVQEGHAVLALSQGVCVPDLLEDRPSHVLPLKKNPPKTLLLDPGRMGCLRSSGQASARRRPRRRGT